MGLYINPPTMTKEDWLSSFPSKTKASWPPPAGHLLVCLVSNGAFTAAAVAVNQAEFNCFNEPTDRRPKVWFTVPIDAFAFAKNGLDEWYSPVLGVVGHRYSTAMGL